IGRDARRLLEGARVGAVLGPGGQGELTTGTVGAPDLPQERGMAARHEHDVAEILDPTAHRDAGLLELVGDRAAGVEDIEVVRAGYPGARLPGRRDTGKHEPAIPGGLH